MKRGRDVKARQKSVQRRLDRAAYSTLDPIGFQVFLDAGQYAERNGLDTFSNKTVKVVWPKSECMTDRVRVWAREYFSSATQKRLKELP